MDKKKTTDALEIIHRRYYEGKPERLAELEQARAEYQEWLASVAAQPSQLDSQTATIEWAGEVEADTLEIREQINAALERSAPTLPADSSSR